MDILIFNTYPARPLSVSTEGKTRDSFQQEITGLQYLAYLSRKNAGEAELNGKEGTTRDSFQQEISAKDRSYISMGITSLQV